MRLKCTIIIKTYACSALALAAFGQTAPETKIDQSDYARQPMPKHSADRLKGTARASDLIGMTVKNYQGEKLGKVDDLAIDVESGRVVQVIVSTGGFLGIGNALTAVPPGALHHDLTQKIVQLDADKAKLEGAPRFETTKWVEDSDSDHLSHVYSYYGQESSFNFVHEGDAVRDDQRSLSGASEAGAQNEATSRTRTEAQRTEEKSEHRLTAGSADATWEKHRHQNQAMIPITRLGQIQKASKVIGTPVKNQQDDKLGSVANLMIDLSSGRIVAVIVSSGGFLGLGDEMSAIPLTALRFTSDHDGLQLDTTKEALSQATHFKANQWPDFDQPSYSSGMYHAYNVEPYFLSDSTSEADKALGQIHDRDERTPRSTQPDNTARNVRDRDEQTLTPLDQGNSKADVATTAQIRKEIVAGKGMSLNARNVKIITKDGLITLRGPVSTEEEKRLIGVIAERSTHSGSVDNQLEVKLTSINN